MSTVMLQMTFFALLQTKEDGVFFHNIADRLPGHDEHTLLSTLGRLPSLIQYRKRDITILTDNQADKAWVNQVLKDTYTTQEATHFPVKHIVVDSLENFEGLESPVVLFIIPRSWGSHYVGSLKYRL